jgi:hypothetical protein
MNAVMIRGSVFAVVGVNIRCPAMPEKTHRGNAQQRKPVDRFR